MPVVKLKELASDTPAESSAEPSEIELCERAGFSCSVGTLHVHLSVERRQDSIGRVMHRLLTGYSRYYNRKYGRAVNCDYCGLVFMGRVATPTLPDYLQIRDASVALDFSTGFSFHLGGRDFPRILSIARVT